jgi:FMN-dependent NADH-azoreductase
MSNVLMIKANDRPLEQSVTVQMYETFVKTYRDTHPDDVVTELDLFALNLPNYGNTALTALFKRSQGQELTPEETNIADLVRIHIDQFLASDKVVIAFPLWNYAAPAPLITYLSYLAQAGTMFRYTPEGPVGLAGGRKVVLLNARGGIYSTEDMAPFEGAIRFVKSNLMLWGITPEEIIIEGHNQMPAEAKNIIQKGLDQTAKYAVTF